tara:strand:+ start:3583 stop:3780 length:198 start_codon:yes stop_codon:yes gene_type:complete
MKDYNKMRCALACYEAEQLTQRDIYYILLEGVFPYKDLSDTEIEKMFVDLWGEEEIPLIENIEIN